MLLPSSSRWTRMLSICALLAGGVLAQPAGADDESRPARKVKRQPQVASPAPAVEEVQVAEDWTISISPSPSRNAGAEYRRIYESIPYRRSEYLANPSYRHDATMELLFGELRPTVIHRTQAGERVVNPRPQLTQPYPLSKGELYSYWPLLQYGGVLPLLSPIP